MLDAGYTKDEVKQYVDFRVRQRNYEDTQKRIEKHENAASSGFWGATGETGMRVFTGVPTGVAGGVDLTIQRLGGKPIDWYSPALQGVRINDAITSTVSQEIENHTNWQIGGQNVPAFLYQAGLSMIDSGEMAALHAIGVPAWAGAASLGTGAGTQAAIDAHERGLPDSQAYSTGVAAFSAETVFEKIPLENMMKLPAVDSKLLKGKVLQILENTWKQGVTEGSEEVLTTIANTLTDRIMNGDRSAYNLQVHSYMNAGMSQEEATKKAFADWAKGLIWDFAGGFLSGNVMGGISTAAHSANTRYQSDGNSLTPAGLDMHYARHGNEILQHDSAIRSAVDNVRLTGSVNGLLLESIAHDPRSLARLQINREGMTPTDLYATIESRLTELAEATGNGENGSHILTTYQNNAGISEKNIPTKPPRQMDVSQPEGRYLIENGTAHDIMDLTGESQEVRSGAESYRTEWDAIDTFRSQHESLSPLEDQIPQKGDKRGTVALIEMNGTKVFGVNSGLLSDAEKDLGREYFQWMKDAGFFRRSMHYGASEAQILTHAEGHALMQLAQNQGDLSGQDITIFCDRCTCPICRKSLKQLKEFLGIRRLTVINKDGSIMTF